METADVGVPTGAAESGPGGPYHVGTINIIAMVTGAAVVNCVATATEVKVQALLEAGYDCPGTPSDAVHVAALSRPHALSAVECLGGPRSVWGVRLARAA